MNNPPCKHRHKYSHEWPYDPCFCFFYFFFFSSWKNIHNTTDHHSNYRNNSDILNEQCNKVWDVINNILRIFLFTITSWKSFAGDIWTSTSTIFFTTCDKQECYEENNFFHSVICRVNSWRVVPWFMIRETRLRQ